MLLVVEVLESCMMKIVMEETTQWSSYLGENNEITFFSVITDFLNFTVLYNYIVPISLYVTIGKNYFLRLHFVPEKK